ncbi:serine hydrolase [Streptomyces sp. WZ-12]|uniref:serine hydrolase n=1 Tax=Streptomyces sp. WZ-12 TaxID=3030210 RepID=UPI0023816408|nr:serine hydrolase [Streptomyces sp. WZ-12]
MSHRIFAPARGVRRSLAVTALIAVTAPIAVAATPASAASASANGRTAPQVVCTSAKSGLADRLTEDIGTLVNSPDANGHTSLALYDRTTKTSCTYDAGRQYDSASVVKVIVLGALLRQAQDEHRDLTEVERTLATKMITRSDNDSTTTLWKQLGLARIQEFVRLAGMQHTVPDPDGYWGLTQINAADQLTLMALLTATNSVLNDDSRAYALDLMSQVIPDQRWGVPAGAPSGAQVHVKNGWLQRTGGGWRVHSIGAFTGGDYDYGIAVLTSDHASMPASVKVIEDLARKIHADLNNTPAHTGQALYGRRLPATSDGSLVPNSAR